jgi:hypothetical protein
MRVASFLERIGGSDLPESYGTRRLSRGVRFRDGFCQVKRGSAMWGLMPERGFDAGSPSDGSGEDLDQDGVKVGAQRGHVRTSSAIVSPTLDTFGVPGVALLGLCKKSPFFVTSVEDSCVRKRT